MGGEHGLEEQDPDIGTIGVHTKHLELCLRASTGIAEAVWEGQ